MNQQNQQPENQNKEHRWDHELLKKDFRCDLDQYDMLKRCSDNKDMTEWNEWREKHFNERIWLEGAWFYKANLKDAKLYRANMKSTDFHSADLSNADLGVSHLENCEFSDAILLNSDFPASNLNGAKFSQSDIRGCCMRACVVDGTTRFWNCRINRYSKSERFTDLTGGIALDNVIITPGEKQLLEYNIRCQNWEEWYKEHKYLQLPVHFFWWVSDYGISAGRIIAVFAVLAVVFAAIYYFWGLFAKPGMVDNLFVDQNGVKVEALLVPVRAIHFSIVVMTVGFSSMHANAHSFWSHIIIGLQMILGFVLLGALVTRFAVLFTAGGPAGKFSEEKKTENKNENSKGTS